MYNMFACIQIRSSKCCNRRKLNVSLEPDVLLKPFKSKFWFTQATSISYFLKKFFLRLLYLKNKHPDKNLFRNEFTKNKYEFVKGSYQFVLNKFVRTGSLRNANSLRTLYELKFSKNSNSQRIFDDSSRILNEFLLVSLL
eukprot:TRINITY_DN3366_c1_g1_i2.p2 TRINITY_DN3366_c1_g1~~TRINITY_DN3366_c1_g1_i2.p2  ORF type:complete len:140 (-),score=0.35 TRINITY_DN3366_c1_g1_i2:606-1025(-)